MRELKRRLDVCVQGLCIRVVFDKQWRASALQKTVFQAQTQVFYR